jgi:hypothetical protein
MAKKVYKMRQLRACFERKNTLNQPISSTYKSPKNGRKTPNLREF